MTTAQLEQLDFKIREAIGDRSASKCDRCGETIRSFGQQCSDCRCCGQEVKCVSSFLAKPLTLADAANAIHESGKHRLRDAATKNMKSMVGFEEWEDCTIGDLLLGCWNWYDDSFDAQSDETKAFLFSLLVP